MAIISLENFAGNNRLAYPEASEAGGASYKTLVVTSSAGSVVDHFPGFNIGASESVRPVFIGNLVDYDGSVSKPNIGLTRLNAKTILVGNHFLDSAQLPRLIINQACVNPSIAVPGTRICMGWRHMRAAGGVDSAVVTGVVTIGDGNNDYTLDDHPASANVYYELSVSYLAGGNVLVHLYRNKRQAFTGTFAATKWHMAINIAAGNSEDMFNSSVANDVAGVIFKDTALVDSVYGITDIYVSVDLAEDDVKTGLVGPVSIVDRMVSAHNGGETGAPVYLCKADGQDLLTTFYGNVTPATLLDTPRLINRTAPGMLSSKTLTSSPNQLYFMVTDPGGSLESFSFAPLQETTARVVAYQTEILAREMVTQAGTVVAGHATEDNKFVSADKMTFSGLGHEALSCDTLNLPVVSHKPDGSALDVNYVNNVTVVVGSVPIVVP